MAPLRWGCCCNVMGGERVRWADLADDSEVGEDPASLSLEELIEEANAISTVRMEEGRRVYVARQPRDTVGRLCSNIEEVKGPGA